MAVKTVMIYEPTPTGHRLAYVRYILTGLAERPVNAFLYTTPECSASEEFQVQLASLQPRVVHVPKASGNLSSALRGASHRLRWFLGGLTKFQPDYAYVPYADGLSQLFGLLNALRLGSLKSRRTSLEAIVMRGSFAYELGDPRRQAIARLSLHAHRMAPWKRLHFIDELAHRKYVEHWRLRPDDVGLLPDPVDTPAETDSIAARRRLRIPIDGQYLVAVGDLSARKGVHVLLHAFARLAPLTDARLLLVGQQAPVIQAMLASSPHAEWLSRGRVIQIPGYVSNQAFTDAIVASDVVCAPYIRHVGSASLVIHAAAASRLVIGSCDGWMSAVIPRHELGSLCDGTPDGLATTIRDLLSRRKAYAPSAAARAFALRHTVPAFASQLFVGLDRDLRGQ